MRFNYRNEEHNKASQRTQQISPKLNTATELKRFKEADGNGQILLIPRREQSETPMMVTKNVDVSNRWV